MAGGKLEELFGNEVSMTRRRRFATLSIWLLVPHSFLLATNVSQSLVTFARTVRVSAPE